MFQIDHDEKLVYSLILVTHSAKQIKEESIEDLMWVWSNKTAVPYISAMEEAIRDIREIHEMKFEDDE